MDSHLEEFRKNCSEKSGADSTYYSLRVASETS
jgi:hypothetical protein